MYLDKRADSKTKCTRKKLGTLDSYKNSSLTNRNKAQTTKMQTLKSKYLKRSKGKNIFSQKTSAQKDNIANKLNKKFIK